MLLRRLPVNTAASVVGADQQVSTEVSKTKTSSSATNCGWVHVAHNVATDGLPGVLAGCDADVS
eukprot:3504458-Prorocentrum_lima.AAC.1